LTAQETSLQQFHILINHTPKSLEKDTIYNPEIRISQEPFNSIASAMLNYRLKHFVEFTDKEMAWMEEKISTLAIALHAEGNYILIYQGCVKGSQIKETFLNTIQITNLYFCRIGHDRHYDEDFIEIFNARMYQLLRIKPPDDTTNRFYGTFKGKGKKRATIELTILKDRTFTLRIQKQNTIDFSEGIWENENDALTLRSKKISQGKSKDESLTKVNWIELDTTKFQLKRNKLVKLGSETWKLKKVL
jgi:hypothetical protein